MKNFITVIAIMAFTFMAANQALAQNQYDVEVRWSNDPTWHSQGSWVIGGRTDQHPIELRFASGNGADKNDGGKTFAGQVKYAQKEGMLGLKALRTTGNNFSVATKKGNANWANDGTWVIGGRDNQGVVKLDAKSTDGGKTLMGTMTYAGEGPIEFRATLISASSAENRSSSAENSKVCSKTLNETPININWVNKSNESLMVHWINYNCEEEKGQYLGRGETYTGNSYAGHAFHIYKVIESDEGGMVDYKTITVSPSNGSMILTRP